MQGVRKQWVKVLNNLEVYVSKRIEIRKVTMPILK